MYCTQYKTLDDFKSNVSSDLFERELENCFMIGAMSKFSKETDDFVMLAVHNPEITNKEGKPKAVLVAFKSVNEYPITFASTTEDHVPSFKILLEFMKQEKILEKISQWVAPSDVSRTFTDLMINDGTPVYLFREMSHYSLNEIDKDIQDMVDKELSEGNGLFEEITLDDNWVTDWGVGFYTDIGEGYIKREFIEAAQKKMIENHDMWKWSMKKDDTFVPVAMTGKYRETQFTASIAGVYTPSEIRGKGYATRIV